MSATWWRNFEIERVKPGLRRQFPSVEEMKYQVQRVDVKSSGRRTDMYQETTAYCATLAEALEVLTDWLTAEIEKEKLDGER